MSIAETMNGLPLVETFHSLQGEGLHAGRSAFFIRLGGCKVGCSWCDTKHSWSAHVHPQRSVAELAQDALQAAKAGAAREATGACPLGRTGHARAGERATVSAT